MQFTSMHHTSVLILLLLLQCAITVKSQTPTPAPTAATTEDIYSGCDVADYYADLLAMSSDPTDWPREDVIDLLTTTHRNRLPNFPTRENPNDIVAALIDVWPARDGTPDEIQLLYRNISIDARPALGLENWRPERYWPQTRGGGQAGDFIFTDVHQIAPADYSVLDDKEILNRNFVVFYGNCGTVNDPTLCVTPANEETPEGETFQDGKIWTPPPNVRGDIARGLFYTDLRYAENTLADCPPFAAAEYGYKSALLGWAAEDLVDDYERIRNDQICRQWQGNRNIFVDYPQLIPEYFGPPDTILGNTYLYSECVDATESPTATPNECSGIGPGDISVFGFNSVNPDQLLFYPVDNIPASVGTLYLTTNAWDGQDLLNTGATVQYDIPSDGIEAGMVFAHNAVIPNYETEEPRPPFVWTNPEGEETILDVDATGDHIHLYCINADNEPHFIFSLGFKSVDSWMPEALSSTQYGKSSALPERLSILGSVLLPNFSNWFYNGTQTASAAFLIPAFSNPNSWIGSDAPFQIDSSSWTTRGGIFTVLATTTLLLVSSWCFL